VCKTTSKNTENNSAVPLNARLNHLGIIKKTEDNIFEADDLHKCVKRLNMRSLWNVGGAINSWCSGVKLKRLSLSKRLSVANAVFFLTSQLDRILRIINRY